MKEVSQGLVIQSPAKVYDRPVILLLSATFILTIARALALPYLVIYFSEAFGLGVADIGLAVGGALIVSSVLGVYGGFLVDRFSNYRIMLAAATVFALAFAVAFQVTSLVPFIIAIVVVNLAYAVVDIAVKSGIGFLVAPDKRGGVFSLKYTLTNVGYAVGPFLGVLFAKVSPGLPFAVAALIDNIMVSRVAFANVVKASALPSGGTSLSMPSSHSPASDITGWANEMVIAAKAQRNVRRIVEDPRSETTGPNFESMKNL